MPDEVKPKRKPPSAGIGRKKGVPNKVTSDIKKMIVGALDRAGGEDYLLEQSEKNPVAFMGLVAKVLPMQLAGPGANGEHVHEVVWRIARAPGD